MPARGNFHEMLGRRPPAIFAAMLLCASYALAFVPVHINNHLALKSPPLERCISYSRTTNSVNRNSVTMQAGNFFSKFARTIVEKARADVERTKRLFQGLELVRSDMSVIDELLSFWNLEDADTTLEKLEEALITRDFGVATASRICDALREDVKSGAIRDPR
jgi:signal recognition particle GTPase